MKLKLPSKLLSVKFSAMAVLCGISTLLAGLSALSGIYDLALCMCVSAGLCLLCHLYEPKLFGDE